MNRLVNFYLLTNVNYKVWLEMKSFIYFLKKSVFSFAYHLVIYGFKQCNFRNYLMLHKVSFYDTILTVFSSMDKVFSLIKRFFIYLCFWLIGIFPIWLPKFYYFFFFLITLQIWFKIRNLSCWICYEWFSSPFQLVHLWFHYSIPLCFNMMRSSKFLQNDVQNR